VKGDGDTLKEPSYLDWSPVDLIDKELMLQELLHRIGRMDAD